MLVNLSASPFTVEKRRVRPQMLAATAKRWQRPLVFVNQVGGQDELVFDGASLALDENGTVLAQGAEFAPDLVVVDVGPEGTGRPAPNKLPNKLPNNLPNNLPKSLRRAFTRAATGWRCRVRRRRRGVCGPGFGDPGLRPPLWFPKSAAGVVRGHRLRPWSRWWLPRPWGPKMFGGGHAVPVFLRGLQNRRR